MGQHTRSEKYTELTGAPNPASAGCRSGGTDARYHLLAVETALFRVVDTVAGPAEPRFARLTGT